MSDAREMPSPFPQKSEIWFYGYTSKIELHPPLESSHKTKITMNRQEEEEEEEVAVAYIGEGLGDRQLSKVKKMKFIFQDFGRMPQKRGEKVISPIVN